MQLRFTFNPYYVQFRLAPGQLIFLRWQILWGRNANRWF